MIFKYIAEMRCMPKFRIKLLVAIMLLLGIWYNSAMTNIISSVRQSYNKAFTHILSSITNDAEKEEEERLKLSPYIEHPLSLKSPNPALVKGVKKIFSIPYSRNNPKNCPITNCERVKDIDSADLVVFDMYATWRSIKTDINRRMRENETFSIMKFPMPESYQRPQNQRWAIFTIDPPFWMEGMLRVYPELTSIFNLTISYRLDADSTYHFGKLKKWPPPVDKDYGALFDKKNESVVWMVSHCITDSRREEYVDRMNSIVRVDIIGKCGNVTRKGCEDRFDWMYPKDCIPDLGKEFKFYLAFENNFCPDYITEKFFRLYNGRTDLIPVVRGGFDYKRYLPSGTYINAADFKSPEDLAHYLVELGNDKERYINMWRTKDRWRESPLSNFLCKICEIAHTHENHTGYHPNCLHSLYGGVQDTCRKPTDF